MIRKLALFLATASLLATTGYVLAQNTGPNGGLVGGTGNHQTELVVSPTELTVYLFEDGKSEGVKGVSIRAVVQQGNKISTVNFTAIDGKKLVGKLAAPLGKGAIVVITGKDDHGHAINSRYVIE